jgi:hypothetical protein
MRRMADWRRIQGRIRKARSSKDPAGELAALYNDTRDAMVAFELARLHEKNGAHAEAAQWYSTAATRFRRAQWKVKAQEALARLGVEVPLAASEAEAEARAPAHAAHPEPESELAAPVAAPDESEAAAKAEIEEAGRAEPEPLEALNTVAGVSIEHQTQPAKKRRRRGRRGGVRHRKRRQVAEARKPELPAPAAAPTHEPATADGPPERELAPRARPDSSAVTSAAAPSRGHAPGAEASAPRLARPPRASPALDDAHEAATRIGPAAWQARQRAAEAGARPGEPALASRLAKLESQLRRLLAAPAHQLDDVAGAPAGPGVFVLSDSDLLDSYYVEACQTLRIGVGNLLRGARTREGGQIRASLAEQLGIAEAKVTKYLKDHCAVRWLQLDDGAQALAHFAIAVLEPSVQQ